MARRIVRTLVLAVLLTSLLASTAFAGPDFTYWQSDSSSIGYFNARVKTFGVLKDADCGMTDNNLSYFANWGLGAWNYKDYAYSEVAYSNAELKIGCMSRATANAYGIPSNAAGYASVASSVVDTGYYNGQPRSIRAISDYVINYIWDTCGTSGCPNTATFSSTKWQNVAAHEHGHGSGYYGHNLTDSTQLMRATTSTYTGPQTKDKQHMGQMYIFN